MPLLQKQRTKELGHYTLKFAHDHSLNPDLPVSMSILALFISFLVRKPYKPATISSYISAIGYAHKVQGCNDPTAAFFIEKLLQSCHKQNQTSDTRLPIDKIMLHQLTTALCYTIAGAYRRALFQAMFLLAFHAFLRIGEITVQNSAYKHPHLIMLHQLQSLPNQLMINFLSFKHSSGQPFLLKIEADKTPIHCPVKSMSPYLRLRGNQPGPLFQYSYHVPVTRSEFNEELRKALVFCRINPSGFKSHSFRIGAATTAAAMGFSDNRIRQLGRWKSDAFKLYIRCSVRTSDFSGH